MFTRALKFTSRATTGLAAQRNAQLLRQASVACQPLKSFNMRSRLQTTNLALGSIQRSFSVGAAQPDMFCYQCEQTQDAKGCTTVGVCGKTPQTAALQDMLVHLVKSVAAYAAPAARAGQFDPELNAWLLDAMFSTLTNVNFSAARIHEYIKEGLAHRAKLRAKGLEPSQPIGAFEIENADDLAAVEKQARSIGIFGRRKTHGDDIIGLEEMATYGLKGALAYAHHARVLGNESDNVYTHAWGILETVSKEDPTVDELLAATLKVGEINLEVLAMLDKGHNDTLGTPEPTEVSTRPVEGKCILVSGHDLVDLKTLLDQVEGTDVKVYTHGEMLPAHSYPELKKYANLAGHYGGPWQLQKFEFGNFPGAIVMTSNCIVEPRKQYADRIFTRSVVGFDGVKHLPTTDFSAVIAKARECDGFDADDVEDAVSKPLTIGFGHKTVLSIADKVIDAVNTGAVSRFFLIGGCDGSEGERSYFTDLAKQAPKDSVMLTLGCGKFRINRLNLGDIGGIPRVLDMGQCNDAYSAVQVAVALADAFKTDVNGLPLSYALSWFEQKAVAVLCSLLHLGIRNIRIGPNLPGFATPAMLNILNEKFNLQPITSVQEDLPKMLQNQ